MDKKIQYIFCVSTGRSGSNYLKKIFDHVSGCQAFHEPDPTGNGQVMHRYSRGDLESMRKFTQKKAEVIRGLKGTHEVYAETNHCFIKGFGWFIPLFIPEEEIGVIILNREKSKIVESHVRIGATPLNRLGRDWISTPDMKDPLVTPPKALISPKATYQCALFVKFLLRCINYFLRKMHRSELQKPRWMIRYERKCLEWYVDETSAKAKALMLRYPNITYFEAEVEDLNSLESIQQMLACFGCTGKEALINIVGKPTNTKRSESETSEQGAGAAPDSCSTLAR